MKKVAGLIILFLIVCSSAGWGAIAHQFDFQGKIMGGDIPPDGSITKDITFKIFDASSGGTQIGSDILIPAVPIEKGVFNVEIPIATNLTFDKEYWLEIIVGTANMGRQRLTTAPYSFNAKNVISETNGRIRLITTRSEAVYGDSNDPTGLGIGVTGKGERYGIYGEGKAGGIGVKASSSTGSGVIADGGILGVKGSPMNNSGIAGIYGESTFSGAIGVYGKNTGASGAGEIIGVKGESNNGYGVYGLSTGPDGYGVFGQGGRYAGFFHGDVNVAGELTTGGNGTFGRDVSVAGNVNVSGDLTSGNGTFGRDVGVAGNVIVERKLTSKNGIEGKSSTSTVSGVYAENTSPTTPGTAFEVGSGKIKIAASEGPGTAADKNHTAAGKVFFEYPVERIIVYNSYVTANSIILLTIQGGHALPIWVDELSARNYFIIEIERGFPPGGSSFYVGYLIIN